MEPQQIPGLQELLREYSAWALGLAEDAADAPTFFQFDTEIETLPGPYAKPSGCLLVASLDEDIVGCVAFKPLEGETCELKRLFVRPTARGHQIGQKLVSALIGEARQAGYHRMYLDSYVLMTHAHDVYRGEGFKDVAPPPDFPDYLKPVVVFMERELV
ncbi:MAG: hypothetical protein QOJ65_1052 [Fimbriimonadaceae bacterium]|nr:hypothetical protein [Fimbriimonadaceae bacterium]